MIRSFFLGAFPRALVVAVAMATTASALSANAAELLSGPMVGATAMRQAKVWLQATGEGKAQIEYWNVNDPQAVRRTKPVSLTDDNDHTAHFLLGLLEPGESYGYRVLIDGNEQKVPQSLAFRAQALWQWRTDAPDWKLLTGSCAYINEAAYDRPGRPYGGPPETTRIFNAMAAQAPDLTVWAGDYMYYREADWDSELGMRHRWRHDRAAPNKQGLLRTGSHLSIWDDHEYGPNDANASYHLKGTALELFKRYWANPSYGLPETPGTFTSHRFNDAEFFLLDNRYHRDHDRLNAPGKSKLGAAQLRWLKNALLASVSPIKVIVLGSQVTNNSRRSENWGNYPEERADFLRFLVEHKVDGVFLLTGDRHFTELLKTERPGTYPLYELTCSPLLSGVPSNLDAERAKPQVVPGTFVDRRNFCAIEFIGPRDARKLVVKSYSPDNKLNWSHELKLADLQTPK